MTASAFIPQTIEPISEPLPPLRWFATAARNIIETFDRGLFSERMRRIRFVGRDAFAIMDPAILEEVLLTKADAFDRGLVQQRLLSPVFPKSLLTTDGEVWKRQRRAASPPFRASAIDAQVPIMAAAGEATADRIEALARAGGPVDVLPEMTTATFAIIRETLLGGDSGSVSATAMRGAIDAFIEHGARVDPVLILGLPDWLPRPGLREARRAIAEMRQLALGALAARRKTGLGVSHDLLDALISAHDPETGQGLDDGELIDNILAFIGAGHETTALALTWSSYLLAGDPAVQEAAAAEVLRVCGQGPVLADHVGKLDLIERVVKEALRLYPPAPFVQRTPNRPVTIGGMEARPGANVTAMIYITHRSSLWWDAPERFDPDRFLPERSEGRPRFAFIPFGGGPHTCIGARFSMVEAAVILAALLRKVRLAVPEGLCVRPVQRVTLRPEGGMPLLVSPRR